MKRLICIVCGLPTDEKGRCFDCFRKHTWVISIREGDGKTTYYPPPPDNPEDVDICDVCEKFTQFKHFHPTVLNYLKDDEMIPQVCSLVCLAMAIARKLRGKS